jgi:NAD(P)-dependent dehydrogenase (short-subunit alcohol dehydrogenase family)
MRGLLGNDRRSGQPGSGAVLVTGASTGIGRALVLDLATRGVTVLAAVRAAGEAPAGDGRIQEILLDVTDAAQIAPLNEAIRCRLGTQRLRGVVNNAGIAVGGPLEYVSIDEMRRQFEVNLFGQLAVTQAVLELLRAHGDGRVVFTSSIGGRVAAPFVGPYAASKHALNGMAEAMRRELRPWHIQVSVLAPGAVATPIWDKAGEAARQLADRLPARGVELYDRRMDGMRRYLAAAAAGHSIPPGRVVRAARHALYARRARAVYLIGAEARVGSALSNALPARMFDTLIARQMRPGKRRKS